MDSPSPIKDRLYQIIQEITESKAQQEIARDPDSLARQVFAKANLESVGGNPTENYETFAESLMHFILTNSLISSQRKITLEKVEIDIVIPDLKTLKDSNKDAVIILFPKTDNSKLILQRLEELQSIQSIKENIWLVQRISQGIECKTYEIQGSGSFFHIIGDIKKSNAGKAQSKFKIFRV